MNHSHEHSVTSSHPEHIKQVEDLLGVAKQADKDDHLRDVVRGLKQFHKEIADPNSHQTDVQCIEATINKLTEKRTQDIHEIGKVVKKLSAIRAEIAHIENNIQTGQLNGQILSQREIAYRKDFKSVKEEELHHYKSDLAERKNAVQRARHTIGYLKIEKVKEEHTDKCFEILTKHVFKIKPENEELFRNEIREKLTAGEQNYGERIELLGLLYKNPTEMNEQERNTYQSKKVFNKTTAIKDTLKSYFVEQHSTVSGFNGLEARLAYKVAQIDKKGAWESVAYEAQNFGSEIRTLKQQIKKQKFQRAVYEEAEHYIRSNETKIHEFAKQCQDANGKEIEGKILFEALLRNLRDVQHTSRVLQMYQDNKQSTGAKVADFVAKALGIAVTQTGNQVAGTMYNHSQGII